MISQYFTARAFFNDCSEPFAVRNCLVQATRSERRFATCENAVGLVRLDYSAEVVQHADLCPLRARERAVLRVRDRVTHRVWP